MHQTLFYIKVSYNAPIRNEIISQSNCYEAKIQTLIFGDFSVGNSKYVQYYSDELTQLGGEQHRIFGYSNIRVDSTCS